MTDDWTHKLLDGGEETEHVHYTIKDGKAYKYTPNDPQKKRKKEKIDEIIKDIRDTDWFYDKFSIIKKLEKFRDQEL